MGELSDRLVAELVDAVRRQLRREASDELRDVYLIGDIEKDTAKGCIERLRELAAGNRAPITIYINSAGGNVTDGLAIHDSIRHVISRGIEVSVIRPEDGVLDGLDRAAGRQRRTAPGVSSLLDHDPRTGQVGGLAVDDGRSPTPRAAQADAGSDLQVSCRRAPANRCGRSSETRNGRTCTSTLKAPSNTD